jgi:hypothetical protein
MIYSFQSLTPVSSTVIIKNLGIEVLKYENWLLNNFMTDTLLKQVGLYCNV